MTFIILSCPKQKKNETGYDFSAAESIESSEVSIETSEAHINTQETQRTILRQLDEAGINLRAKVMMMKEDIDDALKIWTRAASYPFNVDSIPCIAYGNGRFVAAGYSRIQLAYSNDGTRWHTVQTDVFDRGIHRGRISSIVYGKGRFVATAAHHRIAHSDDGITWTLAENGGLGDYSFYGISYGNGRFVVVGYNRDQGNGIIGYSDDGETWTLAEDGSLDIEIFYCIGYGNGMLIAGGSEGNVAYSDDGKTWTAIPGSPFEDRDVRYITYGNGRFVVFCSYFQGYNPMIYYSDNGIDWTAVPDGPFEKYRYPVYNIVYGNGIFITVSHSARMAYSIDGETWYSGSDGSGFILDALAGTGANLDGIAYGNGRFVIGCGNGLEGSSRIAWCDVPVIANDVPLEDLQEEDDK